MALLKSQQQRYVILSLKERNVVLALVRHESKQYLVVGVEGRV